MIRYELVEPFVPPDGTEGAWLVVRFYPDDDDRRHTAFVEIVGPRSLSEQFAKDIAGRFEGEG